MACQKGLGAYIKCHVTCVTLNDNITMLSGLATISKQNETPPGNLHH